MAHDQWSRGPDDLAAHVTNLDAYLTRHQPVDIETAAWNDGLIHLRITSYLTDALPPTDYVTSVRAVVFRGREILAFRDSHGVHILPGGRREPGETLEETLRREILEETGWKVVVGTQFGVSHFRHLTPKPADYPYPYPDFLQIIYLAEATEFVPTAIIHDDFVQESFVHPISQVDALVIAPSERRLLDAALRLRSPRNSQGK